MKPKLLSSHSTTPLPKSPETRAREIKEAFIRKDPHRAALFERVKLEAEAKIAARDYLRALGQIE